MKQCHHTQVYKNWGASGTGFANWWLHKRVIMGMIPLGFFLAVTFLVASTSTHAQLVAWFAKPCVAVATILFLILFFYHAAIEIKGCIQDYIEPQWFVRAFVVVVQLAAVFACSLGVFAVLKISLGSGA